MSGATQILPGSEAAYDACGEMGERKYFDIVLGDIERQTPIADQRLMDMAFGMQDRLKEHGNFDSHPVFMGGKGNSWRVLVDDKYTCNENALRFDPNSEALSGKKLRILDEVLASMERTMMERAAATPLPPVKKEFASQVLHPKPQTLNPGRAFRVVKEECCLRDAGCSAEIHSLILTILVYDFFPCGRVCCSASRRLSRGLGAGRCTKCT